MISLLTPKLVWLELCNSDIKFGASHWTGLLSSYIRLYVMKFAKQDHLMLLVHGHTHRQAG